LSVWNLPREQKTELRRLREDLLGLEIVEKLGLVSLTTAGLV
jgi:hypothetical protein